MGPQVDMGRRMLEEVGEIRCLFWLRLDLQRAGHQALAFRQGERQKAQDMMRTRSGRVVDIAHM
ncbi:hypothetical protein D3C87_2078250 [compost metagenome]